MGLLPQVEMQGQAATPSAHLLFADESAFEPVTKESPWDRIAEER